MELEEISKIKNLLNQAADQLKERYDYNKNWCGCLFPIPKEHVLNNVKYKRLKRKCKALIRLII